MLGTRWYNTDPEIHSAQCYRQTNDMIMPRADLLLPEPLLESQNELETLQQTRANLE